MQVVHQSRPVVPRDRLVRLNEVISTTGCKKSTIYLMIAEERFPKPVRLTGRMVAWSESAVLSWVQERIAEAATGNEPKAARLVAPASGKAQEGL